jgi:hypothetical protein
MDMTYPTVEEILNHYVYAIIKFRRTDETSFQPLASVGTGFTFGNGIFVTCWHCVSGDLESETYYGIGYGDDMVLPDQAAMLGNVTRVSSGADLALATVGITVSPVLRVGTDRPTWGSDVIGLGVPLPDNTIDPVTKNPLIRTQHRVLKGYISSVANHSTGGAREAKYFELGMPVPRWASGSPLLDAETLEIVGVLAGEKTSEIGDSGAFTVGLAVHLDVLREALDGVERWLGGDGARVRVSAAPAAPRVWSKPDEPRTAGAT